MFTFHVDYNKVAQFEASPVFMVMKKFQNFSALSLFNLFNALISAFYKSVQITPDNAEGIGFYVQYLLSGILLLVVKSNKNYKLLQ